MIPLSNRVRVDKRKIINYLLDDNNPQNKGKALFFENVGYDKTDSDDSLRKAIEKIPKNGKFVSRTENFAGKKYEICGKIIAPNGKTYQLTTVWIVENNIDELRFVTAYPKK